MKRLLEKIIHTAWLPLTPRGVATFAHAPAARVWFVQLLAAIFTALSVVWFLGAAWFPVVRAAIAELPEAGIISHSQLDWRGEPSVRLAGNVFLSLGVDLQRAGRLSREAHIAVELGRSEIRAYSLLGYAEFYYPAPGYALAFNRAELAPRWDAWRPWLLGIAAAATVASLFASWFLLAAIYCAVLRLVVFFSNRDLGWGGCWKLASVALMPGAVFMTLSLVAYGFTLLDPLQLAACFAFHFVIGWIYLFVSLAFLPRDPQAAPRGNPFAAE